MKLVEKIVYTTLERQDGGEFGRVYVCPEGNKLPSVTNILEKTKPEKDKKALEGWRKNIGYKNAENITQEAAVRGSHMHAVLEKFIKGLDPKRGSNPYYNHGFSMAQIIIKEYLTPFLDEVWGLETNLWFPSLYAGTTDMVGVYQGIPSILDYKQTNKPKADERVFEYKLQLAAYMLAHNKVFGTNIDQGVILMCSKDFIPQSWIVRGEEIKHFQNLWWQRVAQYYQV